MPNGLDSGRQGTKCITPNDCVGLSFGPVVDGVVLPFEPERLLPLDVTCVRQPVCQRLPITD